MVVVVVLRYVVDINIIGETRTHLGPLFSGLSLASISLSRDHSAMKVLLGCS